MTYEKPPRIGDDYLRTRGSCYPHFFLCLRPAFFHSSFRVADSSGSHESSNTLLAWISLGLGVCWREWEASMYPANQASRAVEHALQVSREAIDQHRAYTKMAKQLRQEARKIRDEARNTTVRVHSRWLGSVTRHESDKLS